MRARAPNTIAFSIRGPISRADLPGLCGRVRALLAESEAEAVVCDVSEVECDAVTVEALARLQLAARRNGCRVQLQGACPELVRLVEFMGLGDVFADR
jgi:ABC-type transporter Mla MlaB component